MARTKIFFDGGARPNPGTMEIAVVMAGRTYIERDIGYGSSLDAEWLALIGALKRAQDFDLTDVVLLGDALAVVNQASGAVTCRGAGIAHLARFRELAGGNAPLVRYIKRTQNLAGIALQRLPMRRSNDGVDVSDQRHHERR